MMQQSFYLIMGVFFQEGRVLGIGYDKYIGSRATIQDGITHTFFSGVIDTYEDAGALQDAYGNSTLFVPQVSDEGFEFTKRYQGNFNHEIFYKFHKIAPGGYYVGHWQGRDKNNWGTARCVIHGIRKEEFFDYQKTLKLLQPFLVDGKLENLVKPQPVKEEPAPEPSANTPAPDAKDDLPF
jgi:hypothetical protein